MLTRTCGESHNRCHTHWDWRWCKLIDEEKMLTKPGGACADECLLCILKQQKMLTKLAGEQNRCRAHWDWRSCLALRLRSLWSRLFLSVYRIVFFFSIHRSLLSFWGCTGVCECVSVAFSVDQVSFECIYIFLWVYMGLFRVFEVVQGFASVSWLRSLWIGSLDAVYTSRCECI